MTEEEIPLLGGDVSEVVRVGDTVRRVRGPHSGTVHAVLEYLEAEGFDGAPRFLGLDDRGREILTYLDGEVAGRPWPAWVADEARAVSVARLLRRLDDALQPLGLDGVDPEPTVGPPRTFLGHRDVTPENTVFRDGDAIALIDFDLVKPSSRVDEVGNLLLWWGAWMPRENREEATRDVDEAARGRALVDAYGLDDAERRAVVPVSLETADRSWYTMRERAQTLGGGWARMWSEGVGDAIRRREQWLRDEGERLVDALVR